MWWIVDIAIIFALVLMLNLVFDASGADTSSAVSIIAIGVIAGLGGYAITSILAGNEW